MIGQQSHEFEMLWDTLFTRCEQSLPLPLYERLLSVFLEAFSKDAPTPQRFLVTGHMVVQGGHAVVTPHHLRIASAAHARPREAGEYLLLDCGKPVDSMAELEVALVASSTPQISPTWERNADADTDYLDPARRNRVECDSPLAGPNRGAAQRGRAASGGSRCRTPVPAGGRNRSGLQQRSRAGAGDGGDYRGPDRQTADAGQPVTRESTWGNGKG